MVVVNQCFSRFSVTLFLKLSLRRCGMLADLGAIYELVFCFNIGGPLTGGITGEL